MISTVASPRCLSRWLACACLWLAAASPAALAQTQPQAQSQGPAAPAGKIVGLQSSASSAGPEGSANAPASTRLSTEIAARYPANSIDTVVRATAALEDVARARTQIEAQLATDERACAPKFFTTNCLDQARERRHAALARLRPIEVEANTTKRRARVDERERALAEKQTKEEPPPREAKAPKPGLPPDAAGVVTGAAAAGGTAPDASAGGSSAAGPAPSAGTVSGPAKASTPAHATGRSTAHQARPAAPAKPAATEAANMAAFDRKAAESAQRQRAIAAKKAEKEEERARKKAAAAAPADVLAPAPR